jgi:hypothetical protein
MSAERERSLERLLAARLGLADIVKKEPVYF